LELSVLYEHEALSTICRALNRKTHVLFRITPGVSSSTHDYIATGKKDSKFGISLDESIIFSAVESVLKDPFITFLGFHFHVGSQIFDNASHVMATEIALDLVKKAHNQFGYTFNEINVGGGFGIKYTDSCEPQTISYFVDAIMATLSNFCAVNKMAMPAVFIEPGRFIVGEAGTTLYTVGSIKTIPGIRTYVAVDGGMTDNIRPALYQAKYQATMTKRPFADTTQTVTLCGKCCETGDILIENLPLPEINAGEIIAVFSTGAYNYSMASHYNKHLIPAMVLVNGDQSNVIIRRETYEDLVQYDAIPNYLK